MALATAIVAGGTAAAAQAQAPAADAQYGAGAVAPASDSSIRRIDYASFGTGDRDVRRDVVRALREGGLRHRRLDSSDARVRRFIAGDFARRELSADGPFAVGTRVASELRTTTPLADRIFHTIFRTDEPYAPVVASVLSRGDQDTAAQGRFVRGLATGFGATGIPTVYVERSDDPRPHLDEFRDIPGVSIVDDIDTEQGRRRLVDLLTAGSSRTAASAAAPTIEATTAAALADPGEGGGTGPLAALALLVGAGTLVVGGAFRRTRRS